jgi:nicotinamide riboside transporter PnuC
VIAFYADPIFMLFVPAFHSLQYLLFVWRYQVNKAHAEATVTERAQISLGRRTVVMRVARFVLVGMVLGFIGFMALPALLEASLTPDPVWGGTVFVFILAAFINLHHYFIDNVIWRRDNEDVRRFLFAPR